MDKKNLYDSPRVEIMDIVSVEVLCFSGNGVNQDYEDDAYEYTLN